MAVEMGRTECAGRENDKVTRTSVRKFYDTVADRW